MVLKFKFTLYLRILSERNFLSFCSCLILADELFAAWRDKKKDHGDIEELSIRSVLSLLVCQSMVIESKIVKMRIFDAALMIISLCMGNWAVQALPTHPQWFYNPCHLFYRALCFIAGLLKIMKWVPGMHTGWNRQFWRIYLISEYLSCMFLAEEGAPIRLQWLQEFAMKNMRTT